MHSALYTGQVTHRRIQPKPHKLRYNVFWLLLDLDEIDALDRKLWLFSRRRWNAASFFDTDHGDGSNVPLRNQVEGHLAKAGIDLGGGAIRLFCMPRIFGYGFNPISIYFCHRVDASLAAILYEVTNTFKQRHSYLIPVEPGDGPIVQNCEKCFYVSPFMDMKMRYEFRVVAPSERLSVAIRASDNAGLAIVASLAAQRKALTNWALLRSLLSMPFLTLKVVAAIHWHAVILWLKGISLKSRPPEPSWPVTVVQAKK